MCKHPFLFSLRQGTQIPRIPVESGFFFFGVCCYSGSTPAHLNQGGWSDNATKVGTRICINCMTCADEPKIDLLRNLNGHEAPIIAWFGNKCCPIDMAGGYATKYYYDTKITLW